MSNHTPNAKRLYMFVRTVSNSRAKPDIKAACTPITQAAPPLDPSYSWCEEDIKATGKYKTGTLSVGIPKKNGASCEIIHWCDTHDACGLLQVMADSISDQISKEAGRHYRIGKLSWEPGDESGGECAQAYLHVRSDEDCEVHEERDEEWHIWWDIDHVDASAS